MLENALGTVLGRAIAAWVIASLIAALAMRVRALAPSGALAAVVIGTVIVTGGGWWSGIVLVAFFATSSALSHWRKRGHITSSDQQRGSRRDAIQVLANGGPAAVFALLATIGAREIWIVALMTSIAVANADTWATEIGSGSGAVPRRITTLRPVTAGTSGGISVPGSFAALAGSAFIACLGGIAWQLGAIPHVHHVVLVMGSVVVGGIMGCLIDSLLGATVQASFRCLAGGSVTEKPDSCKDGLAELASGIRWIDNDIVNVVSVTAGALIVVLGLVLI